MEKIKNIIRFQLVLLSLTILSMACYCQISVLTKGITSCDKSDGKATITVKDAPSTIEFEYGVDGTYQSANVFENLSSGDHVAYVRDKKTKCEFSKTFTIEKAPNDINISISGLGTQSVCNRSFPTTTLTATASGGSGQYDFSWPGGVLTVSGPGRYSVSVTDKQTGCKESLGGDVIYVPIRCAKDPNDIVGPEGYGPSRMIAKSKTYPYTVRFENDPKFATAPAQIVKINHPIHENANIFSFRLSDYGFAGIQFKVPEDKTFYTTRLNLTDSLGIVVDVTAGIDVTKREVFWIFESKDPLTGLPPSNTNHGFLPVNDSTKKGEGFVSYIIKAANNTQTGDSIKAKASIVFDINEPIETPSVFNVIDALPPISSMKALPTNSDSPSFILSWSGYDDFNGSGIRDYSIYVSENGGNFNLFESGITDSSTSFTGAYGNSYRFFSIATDNVGNQEPMKNIPETEIQLIESIACRDNLIVVADENKCTAIIHGIDPIVKSSKTSTAIAYKLSGATNESGLGSANGRNFNSGITIVQYKFVSDTNKQCTFTVTVNTRQEICGNGIDDNCNGQVDEDCTVAKTWYRDADGDGYGNANNTVTAVSQPQGFVESNSDCNDTDSSVHPGATELCDGKDNDCNGLMDDAVNEVTYFQDLDGDGFGNSAKSISACNPPQGYVGDNTDCDDNNINIHVAITYYRDADNDGYGNALAHILACTLIPPQGYVSNSGDCDDTNNSIHPNAPEICDQRDNNCDGQIDEGFATHTYYQDADDDGYGNAQISIASCIQPVGYVTNNKDCNDGNNAIHPGTIEVCDGLDNDCNGKVDEKCSNNSVPGININDVTVYESQGNAILTVRLTGPSQQMATVKYSTANRTAVHPKDYTRASGSLQFVPGVTSMTISIPIILDNINETAETFELKLSNANNANILDELGVVTIIDGIITTRAINTVEKESGQSQIGLTAHAVPNPSNNTFKLTITSNNQIDKISIVVFDILGRIVEEKKGFLANNSFNIGSNYKPGIYMMKVMQGKEIKTLKLIKSAK
jgi:hypothetical protein